MFHKFLYYYIPLVFDLCKLFAFSALATAVIETSLFAILKFTKKHFLLFVFFINILSNVLLNIAISFAPDDFIYVIVGELIVVISEFIAFWLFLKPSSAQLKRLFLITILANIFSYSFGLFFYKILGIF